MELRPDNSLRKVREIPLFNSAANVFKCGDWPCMVALGDGHVAVGRNGEIIVYDMTSETIVRRIEDNEAKGRIVPSSMAILGDPADKRLVVTDQRFDPSTMLAKFLAFS